jgi:serine/threonine protein kinase
MGIVYEAEDLLLGRHVALKLIAGADAPDPTARERFWREARIASALNHPGICTIHEIGEHEGQPFLVMELLEGQSLDRLFAGHAVPAPRLCEIGAQLADALDAAHRKGILHRDVKPANIFITGSGQAKILDFGLARIENTATSGSTTDAGISERDRLTRSGATLGTVAYMSPEQARGEMLDARSDLFSLGVVLYEMATANHPFKGTTSAVVFDKLLNYHPPSPSSLNHELPAEFENILNKALEKDRDLRYQSASDLRADLRRLLRNSSGFEVTTGARAAAAGVPGHPGPSHPSYPYQGPSYPGMVRVGAAAPDLLPPSASSAAGHPPLQLIPKPPQRGRTLRPAWLAAALAALVVAGSALAAMQYFAHKKAPTVTNVTASAPSVTAAATNPASAHSPATIAAKIPAIQPAPVPVPKTKPSAGTPKTAAGVAPAASPAPSAQSASSYEDDAGSATGPLPAGPSSPETPAPSMTSPMTSPMTSNGPLHAPFRRAFAASPSLVAHHLHRFGGFCTGTLQMSPETISYRSDTHSFNLTRDQISLIEGDTIVESTGRRWRFEIPGRNAFQVHSLLARWFAAIPAPR